MRQLRYRGNRTAESGRSNSEVVEPEAPSRLAEDPTEVFIRANLYEGKEVRGVVQVSAQGLGIDVSTSGSI